MPAATQSSTEHKTQCIEQMGPHLGAVYSEVWQEVARLHKKWADYVALFGTNPERIELLNRAAPSFFRSVQDALWENTLLHLARLTDRPRSAGKDNLSIRLLAQLVADTAIGTSTSSLAQEALNATAFARDWRNRRLAHADLDLAINPVAQPLEPASRAAVKAALQSIVAVVNTVASHYLNSTTHFDLGFDESDAASLLHIIRDGIEWDEERFARIKRGELGFEHLRPRPI